MYAKKQTPKVIRFIFPCIFLKSDNSFGTTVYTCKYLLGTGLHCFEQESNNNLFLTSARSCKDLDKISINFVPVIFIFI